MGVAGVVRCRPSTAVAWPAAVPARRAQAAAGSARQPRASAATVPAMPVSVPTAPWSVSEVVARRRPVALTPSAPARAAAEPVPRDAPAIVEVATAAVDAAIRFAAPTTRRTAKTPAARMAVAMTPTPPAPVAAVLNRAPRSRVPRRRPASAGATAAAMRMPRPCGNAAPPGPPPNAPPDRGRLLIRAVQVSPRWR